MKVTPVAVAMKRLSIVGRNNGPIESGARASRCLFFSPSDGVAVSLGQFCPMLASCL